MRNYFYILFLSPILAFVIYTGLNIRYYGAFGAISTLYFLYYASKTKISLKNYHVTLILLSVYYFIWAFFNGEIREDGFIKFFFDFTSFHTLMALLIIDNYTFSSHQISRFVKYIKYIILLSLGVSIIQVFIPGFFIAKNLSVGIVSDLVYEARRTGVFGYLDSNGLGISFIAIYSVFLSINYSRINKSNRFLLTWGAIGGVIAFLSNARYVMLVYLFVLFQVFVVQGREIKFRKIVFNARFIISFFFISIVVGISMIQLGYDITAFVDNRLSSKSSSSRLLAIDLFQKYFLEKPIFGTGERVTDKLLIDLDGQSSQLHVGYLSHLFEFGILGSILLFTFWGQIILRFYKVAKKTGYWGSFFGFASFLFANLTLVHYDIINFGILVLFIFNRFFETNNTISSHVQKNKVFA